MRPLRRKAFEMTNQEECLHEEEDDDDDNCLCGGELELTDYGYLQCLLCGDTYNA